MVEPNRTYLQGCEKTFLALKRKSFGKVEYRVFPAKCHSWDCPVCAKEKARKYRDRMHRLFDGRKLWMYTFTYYHSRPAAEVWKQYSVAWNRFRTAAAKRYGRFSYARILEHHHQSPYPHIHIIADKAFEAVWMASELRNAGFGYQAKCKEITTEGAAVYVTKYLSKPWSCETSKTYRRLYRLRVVAFGGDAYDRSDTGHDWKLIARSSESNHCCSECNIDVAWEYGNNAELKVVTSFEAFIQEIYVLKDELIEIRAEEGDKCVRNDVHNVYLPNM